MPNPFSYTLYLYYMGNTEDGEATKEFNWTHRNNQRIDVRIDNKAYDALMVNNPFIAQRKDGKFVLVYKAVSKQKTFPAEEPYI